VCWVEVVQGGVIWCDVNELLSLVTARNVLISLVSINCTWEHRTSYPDCEYIVDWHQIYIKIYQQQVAGAIRAQFTPGRARSYDDSSCTFSTVTSFFFTSVWLFRGLRKRHFFRCKMASCIRFCALWLKSFSNKKHRKRNTILGFLFFFWVMVCRVRFEVLVAVKMTGVLLGYDSLTRG
jgi:hypothetical protein